MKNKVGRNELCPCGSNKKYKKCCLMAEPDPKAIRANSIDTWIKTHISKLNQGEIDDKNHRHMKEVETEFTSFKAEYESGICPTCHLNLSSFNETAPCVHWLLNPPGFRKKHLGLLIPKIDAYGFFRIEAYLRWVANLDKPFMNINDNALGENGMVIQETITLGKLEWSFSCTQNDYFGHEGTANPEPHYHFQMRIEERPFINYSDNHLKFSDEDKFKLHLFTKHPEKFRQKRFYDAGMDDLLKSPPETLIDNSTSTTENENGTISIQTVIQAEEGHLISGGQIADLIEEAQKLGKPVASLLRDRVPNSKIITVVSDGPGVKEQAMRGKKMT